MSHRLTPTEQDGLEADGFVLRPSVFDPDEVAAITGACEELVERMVRDRQGKRFAFGSYVFDHDVGTDTTIKWEGDTDIVHGIEPLVHLSEELGRWVLDTRFIEPMIDIVDDPQPVLFTEKLNLKRPRHGGVNPLHQDYPYWETFADDASRIATAMLFLDDASLENGTLEVVPGSHHRGKWPGRTDRDTFGNLEIDPAEEDGVSTVPIEVPAGSVVYFGPLLVHKSAPNRSDRERRTLLFSYQPHGHAHVLECYRRERARRDREAG
jgi:ectoine hydroxylase